MWAIGHSMPFIYNVLIIASIVKKESALTSHILKQRKNLNFPVRNEKKNQNRIKISITYYIKVIMEIWMHDPYYGDSNPSKL